MLRNYTGETIASPASIQFDENKFDPIPTRVGGAANDRPIAASLTDLAQRDMLEDTLVVWGGEFGRTAIEDKVHIHDLHATMLHLLGLDHTRITYHLSGRDFG